MTSFYIALKPSGFVEREGKRASEFCGESERVDVIELPYIFVLLVFSEILISSSVIWSRHFRIIIFLPMNSSLFPNITVVEDHSEEMHSVP